MKYNRLTILCTFKRDGKKIAGCLCDCGNSVNVSYYKVLSGDTKSCGCYRREIATKHGFARHPLYSIWEKMISRCYNPNQNGFEHYGGKGIIVNDEWKNNAGSFCKWALDNGWVQGLSIERLSNSKNYEPSNCTLIPRNDQPKNTSRTIRIELDGITDTRRGWAIKYGINPNTLVYRMNKMGMDIKTALSHGRH